MKTPLDRRSERSAYEKSDWDFWTVTEVGAVIVALVLLSHLAAGLTLHLFKIKPNSSLASPVLERTARLPPEPRLQTHPAEDLKEMRRAEDLILNSSGWVDRAQGIVRIPIEHAIDLTARRGLPARPDLSQKGKETTP